ncbi:DUF887-domain-containing protein [Athelia psychrophila]|uniref:DUF887-domain-containing protein n=1 Tax=Athelia psychrophila TaxID=1759441 RepID=A0A166JU59_9AGAM|nr:DUF887-domain-containing protein [Fibularhizoctonia sp. CBS 109695]
MTAVPSAHEYLQSVSNPFVDFLGLAKISKFSGAIFGSFVFFTVIHLLVAPAVSQKFFPNAYTSGGKKGMNNWSIHVASLIHSVIVIILAACALDLPALENDRAFGWDDRAGPVLAFACGYFIWDTLDAIFNFIDVGFVLHGLSCTLLYTMGFSPFLAYYGVRCLFWELSTVFLNIHWFLDKTGRTGTKFQLINGFFLLVSFFGVRLVWGGMVSYQFFHTLYETRHEVSLVYLVIYGAGNLLLQSLNIIWFAKMVTALKKRFKAPPTLKDTLPAAVANGEGHRYV